MSFKEILDAHPEWIAPRSDQHTVIGMPDSSEHRKTFVEPGGSFSPGVGTFGVSLWLFEHNTASLFSPEEMPLADLFWNWEQGYLPILNCHWLADDLEVNQQLFASSLGSLENIVNSWQVSVRNAGESVKDVSVCVVIRPYGPAGGKIYGLSALDERTIAVNGNVVLLAQQPQGQFGVTAYSHNEQEISPLLKRGTLPAQSSGEDSAGLCSGALVYRLVLQPGECQKFYFDFFVHPLEKNYLALFRDFHVQPYAQKLACIRDFWEWQLKRVQLQVPDRRFQHAYYSTLAQMLIANVRHEVRIATVTYPFFWLRDGVYILNALDKAGLYEEVRQHLSLLCEPIFAGGFGAEPDAFGEGIWAFFTHFQLTRDKAWLRSVYPYLKVRAEWIIKARTTTDYIYADTSTRVPANRYRADTDLICEPARDGLIQGRMDWHRPLIWINAFSYLGLTGMVEMAHALGFVDDTVHYQREATALHAALKLYSAEHFGENERDYVCAIWPTGAFSAQDAHIQSHFAHWWQQARLRDDGRYCPEPLWKYFELGQAHNYLLLRERDKVWQTVDYYLQQHDVSGLYGWLEDNHDIVEHWQQIEGWYKLPARMPHGWVSAELFLLLRDMLLYEDQRTLIIGQGIPAEWLEEGKVIAWDNLPTPFGALDVHIECNHRELDLTVHFHNVEYLPDAIMFALPWQSCQVSPSAGRFVHDRVVLERGLYQHEGHLQLSVACSH